MYVDLAAEATKTEPRNMLMSLMPIVLILVVFYLVLMRPKQKEQKKRQQMLGEMKKYDRVMTIGGIVGTVMELRDDEVILKVDDSTNTRMKFGRGAIQKVLTGDQDEKSSK